MTPARQPGNPTPKRITVVLAVKLAYRGSDHFNIINTGNEHGGYVSVDKLSVDLTGDGNSGNNNNATHLKRIALHWANDSQSKNKADSMIDNRGHRLGWRTNC